VACCCEDGDELSGSMKRGAFPDRLIEYSFLKNDSAPRSLLVLCVLWTINNVAQLRPHTG
jgi:hypothetical protein